MHYTLRHKKEDGTIVEGYGEIPDRHSPEQMRNLCKDFAEKHKLEAPRLTEKAEVGIEFIYLRIRDGQMVSESQGVFETPRPRRAMTPDEFQARLHTLCGEMPHPVVEGIVKFLHRSVDAEIPYVWDTRAELLKNLVEIVWPPIERRL